MSSSKASRNVLILAAATAAASLFANAVRAGDVLKADVPDPVDLGSSWVGGIAPTAADVAVYDLTVATPANTTGTFSSDLSWMGIRVSNPASGVVLTSATNSLNLGSAGIDLSAATVNLQVNAPVIFTAAQNWNVIAGRTISATGTVTPSGFGFTSTGTGVISINTYNYAGGAINTSGGALNIANPLTIASNATLNIGGTSTLTVGGTTALNNASLVKTGTGAATLGGLSWNTATLGVDVQGGSLTITAAPQTFTADQTFSVAANSTLSFSGSSQFGATTITKTGSGVLRLASSGGNGTILLNGGTLNIPGSTNIGGPIVAADGTGISFNTGGVGNQLTIAAGGTVTVSTASASTGFGSSVTYGSSTSVLQIGSAANIFGGGGSTTIGSSQSLGVNTGTFRILAGAGIRTTASLNAPLVTLDLQGAVGFRNNNNTLTVGALIGNGTINTGTTGDTVTVGALNATSTFSGTIAGGSGFTKTGTGVQTLSGSFTTTGALAVNVGTVLFDGIKPATATGNITVANNATLGGTGSVLAGTTLISSGGRVSPGDFAVGTLNLNALTFSNGATGTFEFRTDVSTGSVTANDLVTVAGQLTLIGTTSLTLSNELSSSVFSANGTYNLFQYGSLTGTPASQLAIAAAAQNASKKYTFATSGNFITLTIGTNTTPIYWNVVGGGVWGVSNNWTPATVPDFAGAFAGFGTPGAVQTGPALISFTQNRTVGTVSFNDPQPFTIGSNTTTATLTLDNAGSAGVVTSLNGSHTLNTAIVLTSLGATMNVANAGDTVTFNGGISGTGGAQINKTGPGTVVLTAAESYDGSTLVTAGILRLAGANNILPVGTTASVVGTIDLNGTNQTVATLGGTGVVTNASATANSFFTVNAFSGWTGTFTDAYDVTTNPTGGKLGVVVPGSVTTTFSVAQTYDGGTTVGANGTIVQATTAAALGGGPVVLNNGSRLSLNSGGTSVFNNNPIYIAPGATGTVLANTLASSVGGTFTFGDATSILTVGNNGLTSFGAAN